MFSGESRVGGFGWVFESPTFGLSMEANKYKLDKTSCYVRKTGER